MHSKGFVHGDLKCDNVLVSAGANPQAKLCDFDRSFDWSALKDKLLVNGTAADAGIEITDAVRYLAPECVEGMLPNSKSDVYSFGMTLYHALAGASPYSDISSDKELHASKLARKLPTRNMQCISDSVWTLITQCCDPAPDQRPTMEKVLEALKLSAGQLSSIAVPVETLVNAAMEVQTDHIKVLMPKTNADGTPVESKPGSRVIPKSYKIVGAVIFTIVVIGVVVGIVVGVKPKPSAGTNSNTGSGQTSSSSSSNAGVGLSSSASSDSSAGSTPTPVQTQTPTLTLLGRQVSTVYTTNGLWGVTVASNESIYLSAQTYILLMVNDGTPTVFAGSSTSGYQDGGLLQGKVRKITSTDVSTLVSLTSSEDIDVLHGLAVDSSRNAVLKFTSTGEMSVVAGSGEKGFVNGIGEAARFSTPWALTIGSDGNLYVAESVNNCIRKIDLATTEVTTYAGICETSGSTDGLAANATFENIHAIAAAANNVFLRDRWPSRATSAEDLHHIT
ncbi:hypothetical protein ON010_g12955 [Phytophthora cinnamomi]|nr:hypothetical protein ON010_g12955 [Phytophthora cinnamomi]